MPHPRHEGVLQVLLGSSSNAEQENHPSRHLLRLLKRPAPSYNGDATLVAVSQGGGRLGDLCDKASRAELPSGHAQRGLEKPPITGEGLLSGPELDGGDQADTSNLFGTLDSGQDKGELTGEGMTMVEGGHKFPPSPPTARELPSPQKSGGPWWKELLASPVKKLRLGHWSQRFQNAIMPDLRLPPPMRPLTEEPEVQATPHVVVSRKPRRGRGTPWGNTRRKDLPKRPSARNLPKPCRRNAVKLATSKKKAEDLVKKVEKDFYANSSRAAQTSRRKTVENILKAGELTLPLTPTALKFVVGTLKEAGYKSAQIYLAEAKNMHVEKGSPGATCWIEITSCVQQQQKEAQAHARKLWKLLNTSGLRVNSWTSRHLEATRSACPPTCLHVVYTG